VWSADPALCRRLIVPALAVPCVAGALADVVADVVAAATRPLILSTVVAGAFLLAYFLRFIWWARVIAGRSVANDERRLAVLRPFGSTATVEWSAVWQLRVCAGARRPEWQRFPSFAWFEALGQEGRVVFTSPDLLVVGTSELARLAAALQRAAESHDINVVVV
jgi:hypothetical protein